MTKYFTKDGLQKIKKELEHLKKIERKEMSEKLRYAVSFGDLKENAAYDEAKDAQAFLEGRILDLEEMIKTAEIIEKNKKTDKVQIGSFISAISKDGKEKFQIVVLEEVNIKAGKISCESPLGMAFIGKRKGDEVKIETPAGMVFYKIIDIS